jgi:anti-sigma factor RsiW
MSCKELTNDLLADFADWQLAPHDRNRVARHLEVCEPCRVRRDDLEVMSGALRGAAEPPPAALLLQLDRAVLGALPRAEASPSVPRRLRSWPLLRGAAAIVLVGLVSFLAGRRTAPGPAPQVAAREIPAVAPPRPAVEPARPFPGAIPGSHPGPAAVTAEPRRAPPPEPRSAPATGIARGTTPFPQGIPPPLLGDLNGDGVVDIADARILQQMITQGLPLPAHADVNGDGVVDIADVREILRAILASR